MNADDEVPDERLASDRVPLCDVLPPEADLDPVPDWVESIEYFAMELVLAIPSPIIFSIVFPETLREDDPPDDFDERDEDE